jgi:hypothetical protein
MVTRGNQKRFFFFAIRVSPQSVLNQIRILPPLPLRAHIESPVLPGVFSILALALDPDLDPRPNPAPSEPIRGNSKLRVEIPFRSHFLCYLVLFGAVWCSLVLNLMLFFPWSPRCPSLVAHSPAV